MKACMKAICITAGIAGAFLLSGTAAVLLGKIRQRNGCVIMCDHRDDAAAETNTAAV